MERGKFIVIEGGEGAGKSTQINELKKILGESTIFTREPGGSVLAEKIREVILSPQAKEADGKTQFALFWASRADHMRETVIPALERGMNVVTDRFDSSSYTYQIYGQEDSSLKDLFYSMRDIYLGDFKPDLYIFMDIDPKVGLERKAEQRGVQLNHFDDRDIDFHSRVRSGLAEFFKTVPVITVDANKDFESVKKELLKVIEKEIK